MENMLSLHDSYLRECDAIVTSVKEGRFVTLDKTVFYPTGGGQPHDTGTMAVGGKTFNVISVGKSDGAVFHQVEPEGMLKEGDRVHCTINWERRYRLMRMHTSAHLLMALIHNETGALGTGNQIGEEQTRIDFDLHDFNKEHAIEYVRKANEAIKMDLPVTVSFMPRDEALGIPGMVKLAGKLPPSVKELRIVEIKGIDQQADGGTHVNSLKEIGFIEFVKFKNQGKNNKRLYYTVNTKSPSQQ